MPRYAVASVTMHFETIKALCMRPDGADRLDIAIALDRNKDGLTNLLDRATATLGLHRREIRLDNGVKCVRWFAGSETADAWAHKHGRPPAVTRQGSEPDEPEPLIANGQFAIAGPRAPINGLEPTLALPAPVRKDGDDFKQYPSRMGNRLYYRDGRVEEIK